MSVFNQDSFGDASAALKALGIFDSSGSFQSDWLNNPDTYLKGILSNDTQRDALFDFLDDVLEEPVEENGSTRSVPLFREVFDGGKEVAFLLLIDDAPADYVHLFVGVEFATTPPLVRSSSQLAIPLFRVPKSGSGDYELFGETGGNFSLTTNITVSETPTPAGEWGLRAIELGLKLPTNGDWADTQLDLTLKDLQLPGQNAPQDVDLDLDDPDALASSGLELVFSVIQAQASTSLGPELAALLRAIGIDDTGSIPPFPIDQILSGTDPLDALRAWLQQIIADPSIRASWFQALSEIFGNLISPRSQGFAVNINETSINLDFIISQGATNLPMLTPRLSFDTNTATSIGKFECVFDVMRIDLGTGDVTAAPNLRAQLHLNLGLDTPDVKVDALNLGVSLDLDRKPVVIIEALEVEVLGTTYAQLDLTNTDVLAEVGGNAVNSLANSLITSLGTAGEKIAVLIGLEAPNGASGGYPTVNFLNFIADPVGALGAHWENIAKNFQADVPRALVALRELITGSGALSDITGNGSAADPWRIPIVAGLALVLFVDGEKLILGLSYKHQFSELGERCAVVETGFGISLLEIDFAQNNCQFSSEITGSILLRSRGGGRVEIDMPMLEFSCEHIATSYSWAPGRDPKFTVDVDKPRLAVDGVVLNISFPDLSQGFNGFDDADWENIQLIIGVFTHQIAVPWLDEIIRALGWDLPNLALPRVNKVQLKIADLLFDPQLALRNWLRDALKLGQREAAKRLQPLARLISGAGGNGSVEIAGDGSPANPYLVALNGALDLPNLAFWFEPDGPPRLLDKLASSGLRDWSPGKAGLPPNDLAQSIFAEFQLAPAGSNGDLSVEKLGRGIFQLRQFVRICEGYCKLPLSVPTDTSLHLVENATLAQIFASASLSSDILGGRHETEILVSILDEASDPAQFGLDPAMLGIDPAFVFDAREADRDPVSFSKLPSAEGRYHILLPPRDAAHHSGSGLNGFEGQVARLRHIVQDASSMTNPVMIASIGAGHAAWSALDQMGGGIDRLLLLGFQLSADQVVGAMSADAHYALRRLEEIIPPLSGVNLDDADLARGRALLQRQMPEFVRFAADAQPPTGWVATKRATLDAHMIYTTQSSGAIDRAFSAASAAGLSLYSQIQDARAELETISEVCAGFQSRFDHRGIAGHVTITGSALVDLVGVELDLADDAIALREPTGVRFDVSIGRNAGWLLGGARDVAVDIELRRVRINGRVNYRGSNIDDPTAGSHVRLSLIGLRAYGQSWPCIDIGVDPVSQTLAVEGLNLEGHSITSPHIQQILTEIFAEIFAENNSVINELKALLTAFGILDGSGHLDIISLTNWLDDAEQLFKDQLNDPALLNALLGIVETRINQVPGVTFDLPNRSLGVTFAGSTNNAYVPDWQIAATLNQNGLQSGQLVIGAAPSPSLAINFLPVSISLQTGELGEFLPENLNGSIQIYPSFDQRLVTKLLPQALVSSAFSYLLDYLRQLNPTLADVLDPALTALDCLRPTNGSGSRVFIPPLLFAEPVKYFARGSVLGIGADGAISPAKAQQFFDALRPILGLAGSSGVWEIDSGVALIFREDAGRLLLGIELDEAQFFTGSDVALGGVFGAAISANWNAAPHVEITVGLRDTALPQHRVNFVVGAQTRLAIVAPDDSEITLFPGPPDFGAIAQQGLEAALPIVLNAIKDNDANVAAILEPVGAALELVEPTGANAGDFTAARLSTFIADPVESLRSHIPRLVSVGLEGIEDELPAALNLITTSDSISLSIANPASLTGNLTFTMRTSGGNIEFETTFKANAIPVLSEISLRLIFDKDGLATLSADIGALDFEIADDVHLRPYFVVEVGHESPSKHVELGLENASAERLGMHYDFDAAEISGRFEGASDAGAIAQAIVALVIEYLGVAVMSIDAVDALLETNLTATGANNKVKNILRNVILNDAMTSFRPAFFRLPVSENELNDKLQELMTLINNVIVLNPSVTIGGLVTIGIGSVTEGSDASVGISIGLADRFPLIKGEGEDIALWLENDETWIRPTPATGGIVVGFLNTLGSISFKPKLEINGVGLRIGRSAAPLLASPIGIGSIAVHGYGLIGDDNQGGVHVEIAELSAAASGAGGSNAIAQGMMDEASEGDEVLAPQFSPSFALQSRSGEPGMAFRFRAGEGDGPWWLPVERQFGPLYVGQVGLGSVIEDDELKSLSILFDGGVSIAGLSAFVDDLELRCELEPHGVFDGRSWSVDLAGIGISADISGVSIAGALRKSTTTGGGVEYLGMLSGRFATYGLTIYGGYSKENAPDGSYNSFFAYGAVVGPFGGPPAFFLTGIGAGLGINRDIVPPDLDTFAEFPMLAALDPSYSPDPNLMAELDKVRTAFPAARDNYWLAAGISFNSFALVDGIAVISVEFGNGFELALYGLARMALPRPGVELVSIELGLIARFSTEEGVIWIQAQLTENSWLFHNSARLTGGFAFVSWFGGPNKGQFVLTLGGYHPSFSREGYPVVPRLGFNWSISSSISVKAEAYFALTSEALMAGGLFEVAADFGAIWAHLSFGGNAIVYFDPFRYAADAHARVSCGITFTVWTPWKKYRVTLSFSLGVYIEVEGPNFHGIARIEIAMIEVTIPFGSSSQSGAETLEWDEFVEKYLELAPNGKADALSGIAGKGAMVPSSDDGAESGKADGTRAHPYEVATDFELLITSTLPLTKLEYSTREETKDPSFDIHLSPMRAAVENIVMTLSLKRTDTSPDQDKTSELNKTGVEIALRKGGAFPIGVWGEPGEDDNKKLPKGDVIVAAEGIDLSFASALRDIVPHANNHPGIAFAQVEAGPRHHLPFLDVNKVSGRIAREASLQRAIYRDEALASITGAAQLWSRASSTPVEFGFANWDRSSAPRAGLLSERVVNRAQSGFTRRVVPTRPAEIAERPPKLVPRGQFGKELYRSDQLVNKARLHLDEEFAQEFPVQAPPSLSSINAEIDRDVPMILVRQETIKSASNANLVNLPVTRAANRRASQYKGSAKLLKTSSFAKAEFGAQEPTTLAQGQIAVFDIEAMKSSRGFENSGTVKASGAPLRMIAVSAAGNVLANEYPVKRNATLPLKTRLVALISGDDETASEGFRGFFGSTDLAYLGRGIARGAGFDLNLASPTFRGRGQHASSGWIGANKLIANANLIKMRFDHGASYVALLLRADDAETAMEQVSIGLTDAKISATKPHVLPLGDSIALIYEILAPQAFELRVEGEVSRYLDGVIATSQSQDNLVERIINQNLTLEMQFVQSSKHRDTKFAISAPRRARRRN